MPRITRPFFIGTSPNRWRAQYWCLLLLSALCTTALGDRPMAPEKIAGVTKLSAPQLVELLLLADDALLVDARLEQEYHSGHIEGAVNIVDTALTEALLADHLHDKASPLIFYCNGPRCLRSSNACTKAISWGYRNVFWFRGGWAEWTEHRYPVSW